MRRPGFEPWNLRVVTDPAGEVVGDGASCSWTATAASSPGSPRARTSAAGAWPRRCSSTRSPRPREHGAARSELSTDSRTGALGLYEKVGMQVTSIWVNRAIELELRDASTACPRCPRG